MPILTLLVLLGCGYAAPLVPQFYGQAIRELGDARLWVAASRAPCPTVKKGLLCDWQIQAKAFGTWQNCQGSTPPSGAAFLASHRYFKIIPKCHFAYGIPLILPPQVIYR